VTLSFGILVLALMIAQRQGSSRLPRDAFIRGAVFALLAVLVAWAIYYLY